MRDFTKEEGNIESDIGIIEDGSIPIESEHFAKNEPPYWNLKTGEFDLQNKDGTHYRPFNDCDELFETFKIILKRKTGIDEGGVVGTSLFMPLIWVKSKEYGTRHLITSFGKIQELDMEVVEISNMNYSMSELFSGFTFLDGSPCGVQEEEN